MSKLYINLTVIDGLFIVFSVAMFCAQMGTPNAELSPIVLLAPYLISYYLFKILFLLNNKWTSVLLLVVISFLCIKELFEGYYQLIINIGKKNGQEMCVGSFSNSGLYGCFLSVCSSLFISYTTRVENRFVRLVLIFLTALALFLLPTTMSRASIMSFTVSMVLLALSFEKSRRFILKKWITITLLALVLGAVAYVVKKPSADGRILMSKIGWRIIRNNGLNGVGIGYYSGAYGEEQYKYFTELAGDGTEELDVKNIPENMRMSADCPYYAFNIFLKTGVEAGPIAMFLLLSLNLVGIVVFFKSGNIWCYPLLSLSVFALFSYPFEISLFPFLFTAFLASDNRHKTNKYTLIVFFAILDIVIGTYYHIERNYLDEIPIRSHQLQDNMLFASKPRRFVINAGITKSEAIVDQNALFDYGQVLNISGDYAKSDSLLLLGTKISSDPMFWNVMGNNSLALGRYREAEERYKHAFYMVPNRLYPHYLLAKLYHAEGDTVRFLDMADKVETFIPKIESANTELLRSEIREIKAGYEGTIKQEN